MKRVYYTYVNGKLCRVEDYGAKKIVTEVRDPSLERDIAYILLYLTIIAISLLSLLYRLKAIP